MQAKLQQFDSIASPLVFFLIKVQRELGQIPPLILFKAKKVLSCKNFFEVVSKSNNKMFTLPTLYFAAGCKHAF